MFYRMHIKTIVQHEIDITIVSIFEIKICISGKITRTSAMDLSAKYAFLLVYCCMCKHK